MGARPLLGGLAVALLLVSSTISAASASAPGAQSGSRRLTATTYPSRFVPGTPGGVAVVGAWQEPVMFDPYYAYQVIEADIATATEGGLVTVTDDLRYLPDQADQCADGRQRRLSSSTPPVT